MNLVVRAAERADLARIGEIQAESEGASQWDPEDYLAHICLVAEVNRGICGFVVGRRTGPDEGEILNLAVAREWRRKGVGRALLEAVWGAEKGEWFLEVRASNRAALALYKTLGFIQIGTREGYYDEPPEAGIVMNRRS